MTSTRPAWVGPRLRGACGYRERPGVPQAYPAGAIDGQADERPGVALVVKARAAAAGYNPDLFSAHSLRAGFLTEAGRQGANVFKMCDHSRHKSLEMVGEYVRNHERFRDHAGDTFL